MELILNDFRSTNKYWRENLGGLEKGRVLRVKQINCLLGFGSLLWQKNSLDVW